MHTWKILVSLILCILPSNQTKNLTEFLRKNVYDAEKVFGDKDRKGTLDIYNEAGLENIKTVVGQMQRGGGIVGQEGLSTFYQISGKFASNAKAETPMIAKQVFVDEDSETPDGRQQQTVVGSEVEINWFMQARDKKNVFFPRFLTAYNLTQYCQDALKNMPKKSQQEQDRKEKAKQFLTKEGGGAKYQMYILFMEKMTFTLQHYLEQVFTLEAEFPMLHTRLRVTEYVASALEEVAKYFTHCDVRPVNIRFKRIPLEKSLENEEEAAPQLEIYPNEFYKMNLGDFTKSVLGEPAQRKCHDFTPGFAPIESLQSGGPPEVDVFGLAVSMVSAESIVLYTGRESVMQNCSFDTIQAISTRASAQNGFDQELTTAYTSTKYFELVSLFWTSGEHQANFLSLAKTYCPELETTLSSKYSVQTAQVLSLEPAKVVFASPRIFQKVNLAALDFAWNHLFQTFALEEKEKHTAKVAELRGQLADFDAKDSDDYKIKQEDLKFYQYLELLAVSEFEQKKEYVGFLLTIVATDGESATPPAVLDFYEKIKAMREAFEAANKEAIDYVTLYKRQYLLRDDEMLDIKSMQASGVDLSGFVFESLLLI